jgi:hypothetical protein
MWLKSTWPTHRPDSPTKGVQLACIEEDSSDPYLSSSQKQNRSTLHHGTTGGGLGLEPTPLTTGGSCEDLFNHFLAPAAASANTKLARALELQRQQRESTLAGTQSGNTRTIKVMGRKDSDISLGLGELDDDDDDEV